MCGIVAVAGFGGNVCACNGQNSTTNGTRSFSSYWEPKLEKTLRSIAHRGPDANAVWSTDDEKVAFGHCRLSINDLSEKGNQPLHDDDNEIHAIVNGEIYECDRLREKCRQKFNYNFKSHCDSELVVALYKHYGAPEFLKHMRGEFAFVIYDGRTGEFIAVRDRCGVKPLFWTKLGENGVGGKTILLASEMKAFLELDWKPEWDVDNIVLGASSFGSMTDFKDVWRIRPGHYLRISKDGEATEHQYWDFDYPKKHEVNTQTVDELVQAVRETLVESVRLRMQADVPVGVYLSGGLDSSALAGMAKYLIDEKGARMGSCDTRDRIACFTIGFDKSSGVDERDVANRTADFLGVDMFVKDMDEEKLAQNFEDCVWHNEQICHDLNTVGKFCLSELVRQKGFKVVLTGEGSDEIFCGYPWHLPDLLLEPDYSRPDLPMQKDPTVRDELLRKTPTTSAALARFGLKGQHPVRDDLMQALNKTMGPIGNNLAQPPSVIFAPEWKLRYSLNEKLEMQLKEWSPQVQRKVKEEWHPIHTTTYSWAKSILPNWLFTTLGDRGEMAHSVEARVPFMDHEVTQLACSIPPSFKQYCDAESYTFIEKWILREAMKPFITEELYKRTKQPYVAPVLYHKEKPLHTMVDRLVTKENVDNLGFLDWDVISEMKDSGFGENADMLAFRRCLNAAAWVVMSQRFGVPPAKAG